MVHAKTFERYQKITVSVECQRKVLMSLLLRRLSSFLVRYSAVQKDGLIEKNWAEEGFF